MDRSQRDHVESLWRQKRNTKQIADKIGKPESEVDRVINRIMDERYNESRGKHCKPKSTSKVGKKRKCLNCQDEFDSEINRICEACKRKQRREEEWFHDHNEDRRHPRVPQDVKLPRPKALLDKTFDDDLGRSGV